MAQSGPRHTGKKVSFRKLGCWVVGALVVIPLVLVLPFAFRVVLSEAFVLQGSAMTPTIRAGEAVVVSKSAYGLLLPFSHGAALQWSSPDLGDVVVFRRDDGVDIIERVVGLPGDAIEVQEDALVRNGESVAVGGSVACDLAEGEMGDTFTHCFQERLADHRYTVMVLGDAAPIDAEAVAVPEGHVYLLGDNRRRAMDSRFHGPVPIGQIKGRVLMVYSSEDAARIGRTVK